MIIRAIKSNHIYNGKTYWLACILTVSFTEDDVTDLGSQQASVPLCLSSAPLQAWPEKARRVGVAIANTNILNDV